MSVTSDIPGTERFPQSETKSPARTWLISPAVDLLFLANLLWPLVFLVELWGGFDARDGVVFWQVYFVTTPHRWITLLIVFGDRQLTARFGKLLFGVFAVIIIVCLSVRISTGALTCLLTVDYLWNAWHFAAQHHGIYRIYGRMTPAGSPRFGGLEKWTMRLLIVYAAVRVAGWSWPFPALDAGLNAADWFLLAIPVGLIVREVAASAFHPGRLAYLLSVSVLYSAMIFAVHFHRLDLMLMLTTASALFHATEYLVIVSWRVQNRKGGSRRDLLSWLMPRWGLVLLMFAIIVGFMSWHLTTRTLQLWLLLNVMVAFLHYSYDGMIWKRKRTQPATTSA
jgi:hypothetical protein